VNNRWIYGLELLVFGIISLRGGWMAVRAQALWSRLLGALALIAAAVTGALLVAFVLNVAIPPILHSSALVGALLVVAHQTARVSQTAPGLSALLLGLYGALAFILPRRRPKRPPEPEDEIDEPDEEAPLP
jgi:hypothetical protein